MSLLWDVALYDLSLHCLEQFIKMQQAKRQLKFTACKAVHTTHCDTHVWSEAVAACNCKIHIKSGEMIFRLWREIGEAETRRMSQCWKCPHSLKILLCANILDQLIIFHLARESKYYMPTKCHHLVGN